MTHDHAPRPVRRIMTWPQIIGLWAACLIAGGIIGVVIAEVWIL